jgi:hypothetical protein
MIPGPQLPGHGFFHRIPAVSSCFRALPEASIYFTNPRFEINNLKSMIWNLCLLMITNAYQPHFEIVRGTAVGEVGTIRATGYLGTQE